MGKSWSWDSEDREPVIKPVYDGASTNLYQPLVTRVVTLMTAQIGLNLAPISNQAYRLDVYPRPSPRVSFIQTARARCQP